VPPFKGGIFAYFLFWSFGRQGFIFVAHSSLI